ncbi:MAG: DUF1330 domain-containing protein [Pseudomonadota bacterium]
MFFLDVSFFIRRSLILVMALLLLMPLASVAGESPEVVEAAYREGELISLIAVVAKAGDDAAAVRGQYLRNAFGLAEQHGMKVLGSLNVTEVISGDFKPQVLAFYSWPSVAAEQAFDAMPEWKPIKATRPDGWDDLRFHDATACQDLTLRFASDKSYTLATAWVNPENPDDYDNYLKGIEPALNALGGRFVYQMRDPVFSALVSTESPPSRLTLVEWKSPEDLDRFLQSDGFKQHSALLTSGTVGFELVRLAVRPRKG